MVLRRVIHLVLCSVLLLAVACKEDPEKKYLRLIKEAGEQTAQDKIDEARITIQSAIALRPNVADNYYKLAELLLRSKRFPEALENYRTAINLDPAHREARLHLAALMIVVRQYEQAESNLRTILEKDPNDFEARVLTTTLDRARNKYDSARQTLLGLLNERPNDGIVLANLGDLELSENKADSAERYFRKALLANPENETVRVALANLLAAQGRDSEAQALLTEVLRSHPSNTTLRLYFAEFLLGRGEVGRAREQFEQMLKTDPSLRDIRDRLYDMYLVSKENEKASALVTTLREFNPEDPALPYFLGRDLERQQKRDEALKQYLRTAQVIANFAPAFRRAGLVQLSLGQEGPALENFNHAIAINPLDISSRLALARMAFLRKDFSEAQGHVSKILEQYPQHLAANILRGDILLLEGKQKEARRFLQTLILLLPDAPVTYLKLGILEEQEGRINEAVAAYEKFLDGDRDVYVGAARLARLYVRRDGYAKAVEQLDKFLQTSKQSKGSLAFVLGSLMLSQGKKESFPRIRELLETAVLLNPEISPAYAALAQLDTLDGNYDAALSRYKKLLERNPRHVSALMLTALTYERMKNYQKAEEAYRSILSFAPDFAPAQNNLAWILVEHLNGNLDEALRLAQRAKESLPQESGVSDTLGWVYYKRGQYRAAVTYLDEAVDLARGGQDVGNVDPELSMHLGMALVRSGEQDKGVSLLRETLKRAGKRVELSAQINEFLKGERSG